jgi:hypothetical protein
VAGGCEMRGFFEALEAGRMTPPASGPFTFWVENVDGTFKSTACQLESVEDERAVVKVLQDEIPARLNAVVLIVGENRAVVEAWKFYAGAWHPSSYRKTAILVDESITPSRRKPRVREAAESSVHYNDELTPYADNQVNIYVIDQNTGEKTFETGGTYRQFLMDNDDDVDGIPPVLLGLEPGKKIEYGGGAAQLFLIYMKPGRPSTNTQLAQTIFGTDGARELGAYTEDSTDSTSKQRVIGSALARAKTKDTPFYVFATAYGYKMRNKLSDVPTWQSYIVCSPDGSTQVVDPKQEGRSWHNLRYRILFPHKEGRFVSDSRVEAVNYEVLVKCGTEPQAKELFYALQTKIQDDPELSKLWGVGHGWVRGGNVVSVYGKLDTEDEAAEFSSEGGNLLASVYRDAEEAVEQLLTQVLGPGWEHSDEDEEDEDLGEDTSSTDDRQAVRRTVKEFGSQIAQYTDRGFQIALPLGSARYELVQALRKRHGLEAVPGTTVRMPLGSDNPPENLRHGDSWVYTDFARSDSPVQERVALPDGPDYVRYTYAVSSDNQKEIGLVAQAMRGVASLKVLGAPTQKGAEFVLPVEVHIQPGSADPEMEAEQLLRAAVAKAGVAEDRAGTAEACGKTRRGRRKPKRKQIPVVEGATDLKPGDVVTFSGFRRRYVVVTVKENGNVDLVALEGGLRDSEFRDHAPGDLERSMNPSRKFVGNFARNLRNRFDALVDIARTAGLETPTFRYSVESRCRRRGGK